MQKLIDRIQTNSESSAFDSIRFYSIKEKPFRVSELLQLKAVARARQCFAVEQYLIRAWPFLSDATEHTTLTPLHVAVMSEDVYAIHAISQTHYDIRTCVDEEGLDPVQVAVVYEKLNALAAFFKFSAWYSKCIPSICLELIDLARSRQSMRSIDALKQLINVYTAPQRTLIIRCALIQRRPGLRPSLLKVLCEMFPAEVDYCGNDTKSPMVLCVYDTYPRQKQLISILHAHGSESHFDWGDDCHEPRAADFPELSQFMRDLHFSRSLTEILFFSFKPEQHCVRVLVNSRE